MIRWLYWMVFGLVGAAAVHLVMILALPMLAERDVTSRLMQAGPTNSLTILEPARIGNLISFADRTTLYAICPFDLSEGPLAIIVEAQETPMSLVFMSPGGEIFSALTDRAATQGLLQLRLVTAEQLRALTDEETADTAPQDLRLEAVSERGVVIIKALVTTRNKESEADRALRRTRCAVL
jgi:uncharacterized membrane protein